ncbi:MAG: YjjG family noncanonical pyrimidine nucleotidase [Saprospiraceae bacterium]
MGKYKWILFDADHTLFDFDKASEEALAEVLNAHGLDWNEGMYSDYKRINIQCWTEHEQGLINRDTLVYERFKRYFDFRQINLDPVSTQQKYLRGLGSRPYLMPGAGEMMAWLKGKIKIGYITNGMTEVQRARLEMIDWHLKFDVIVIAGEIGHSKPHRPYFEYVDRVIGHPFCSEVVVVGDSLTADIEGAAAFGYHTCWYNPNDEICHLEQKPDYTIAHLDEIKGLITG